MICELGVRSRNLVLSHVAGDSIACAHRTCLAWMLAGNGARGVALQYMTAQALAIIRNGITRQGSMRIVAGHAAETRIAFSPASALFQTVRLKPDVRHTGCI